MWSNDVSGVTNDCTMRASSVEWTGNAPFRVKNMEGAAEIGVVFVMMSPQMILSRSRQRMLGVITRLAEANRPQFDIVVVTEDGNEDKCKESHGPSE